MDLDRRRVVIGYILTLVGLLLAFIVADLIPIPEPPACYTAVCNLAYVVDLVGLAVIIAGMVAMGLALFPRRPAAGAPAGSSANPQYLLPPPGPSTGTGSSAPSSPPSALPTRAVTNCPGCGAPITSAYGFCPRCGRNLPK